ncbi:hypothetical protein EJB05_01313, partial [Eragrostis curvula]
MFASCITQMKKGIKDQIVSEFLQMPAASYREGFSEDMKKQRLHRRIVASQRLISDKVRLVYKAEAAQSAEKSRWQVAEVGIHFSYGRWRMRQNFAATIVSSLSKGCAVSIYMATHPNGVSLRLLASLVAKEM